MDLRVEVRASGPLFQADRVAQESDDFMHDAVAEVAHQGLADVHLFLNRQIKHPTPYYETQITTERAAADRVIVHDRGIVYGPWLEGTGSRNETTRFKGYASFRKATQELERKAGQLVEHVLRRYLSRWQ